MKFYLACAAMLLFMAPATAAEAYITVGQKNTVNDVSLLKSRHKMRADRVNDAPPPPPPSQLPAIALKIAACESGNGTVGNYSLTVKNPHSSASGKYQFINSTWEWVTGLPAPASAHDEYTQDQAFLKLYKMEGTRPWNPSRHCWSRL